MAVDQNQQDDDDGDDDYRGDRGEQAPEDGFVSRGSAMADRPRGVGLAGESKISEVGTGLRRAARSWRLMLSHATTVLVGDQDLVD
jgi:hypothetical protein